ncbi:MAG: hypothetical protein SPL47_01765 [Bacteroidales bacterium]|nr:hypothetical protein [Bacteroidales bacterium]
MKKIFLFIGLSFFTLGAFAEGVPSVTVNKSQGGWSAIFNLYNYVTYTPAELTDNGVAQLNCQGSGFTWCRVPNCSTMPVNDGSMRIDVTEQTKIDMFTTAINDILGQIENDESANAGTDMGTRRADNKTSVYTKKLAVAGQVTRGRVNYDTYVVKAVRKQDLNNGTETVDLFLDKVRLF